MQKTPPNLAVVRQLEAVGFRAWPASSVHYDGTWAIRMTAAHPSKRLNSVNPLDPGDTRDIPARVERAARRFREQGRKPCFRLSPLAPSALEEHLEGLGWTRRDETIVMAAALQDVDLSAVADLAPVEDVETYVSASLAAHDRPESMRAGLKALLEGIRPDKGLFVLTRDGRAVANALCVRDGPMAGLFDVGALAAERRRGHGRAVVGAALRWAAAQGARTAWLQIEAANVAGLALYEKFGFREAYRYAYRESEEA